MSQTAIAILPTLDDISAFNKAAGDSFRLEVLRVLAQDAYAVQELCEVFDYRQSGMSHHLKVLAEAGLVAKRREGNTIFYSRAVPAAHDSLAGLQQELYRTVDAMLLRQDVRMRLQTVRQSREQLSQRFFMENAQQFKEQQDLIADYPVYGSAVIELLDKVVLPSRTLAIEVGPGTGEFLQPLSERFEHVIALDNAEVMLDKAQHQCAFCNNIDFVCSNTAALLDYAHQADCVVMNMVLHHTPSPADIFADIAQCLKSQGMLLVCDLCRHEQDWAKASCRDIWLGFDPEELQRWAESAGLRQGHSKYLALRNGFQIQLQQFIKC